MANASTVERTKLGMALSYSGLISAEGRTMSDERVVVADYDPAWPEWYRREADRLSALLGARALRLEHTGSTSVPGLAAKPVIDILLVVADSADEPAYVPALE